MANADWRSIGTRLARRVTDRGLRFLHRRRRAAAGWLHGAVDLPPAWQPFHGWVLVRGWCCTADGAPVEVVVTARGAEAGRAAPALPRPDVAARFPHLAGADRSGFELMVRAADLPAGRAVLLECSGRALRDGRIETGLFATVPVVRWRPRQRDLPRSAYRDVWDRSAGSAELARTSVSSSPDDQEWNRTGELTAATVARMTDLGPDSVVLEIGCGAGRIGAKLAPRCRRWIGADVSANMLRYAREALGGHGNVSFVELNGVDLHGIADESVDVVYCTAVFMHLDEWDRYRYVAEAFRVLRPGGRLFVDNVGLSGDMGWHVFLETSKLDAAVRPPHVSRASTGEELQIYGERAGFADVSVERWPMFVTMVARKPGRAAPGTGETAINLDQAS